MKTLKFTHNKYFYGPERFEFSIKLKGDRTYTQALCRKEILLAMLITNRKMGYIGPALKTIYKLLYKTYTITDLNIISHKLRMIYINCEFMKPRGGYVVTNPKKKNEVCNRVLRYDYPPYRYTGYVKKELWNRENQKKHGWQFDNSHLYLCVEV